MKGKKKFDYPLSIQKGITLHRIIDSYTDEHEATKEAKEPFRPYYRLYSAAFVDVVYDHFLANDENEFTETSLFDFSRKTYSLVDQQRQWLPERFLRFFNHMRMENWLFNYRKRSGTEQGFRGVAYRAAYINESETAARLFEQHYQLLQQCYRHFWKDMKPFAMRQFELLNETGNP